jgi:hypothetical protein
MEKLTGAPMLERLVAYGIYPKSLCIRAHADRNIVLKCRVIGVWPGVGWRVDLHA